MADGQMAMQVDTLAPNKHYSTQELTNTSSNKSHDRDSQSSLSCPHPINEAPLIPSPASQYDNSPPSSINKISNSLPLQASNESNGEFSSHAPSHSSPTTSVCSTSSQPCTATAVMDRARVAGPTSLLHHDYRRQGGTDSSSESNLPGANDIGRHEIGTRQLSKPHVDGQRARSLSPSSSTRALPQHAPPLEPPPTLQPPLST
ncbi:PREDICTED: putative protein TPRXL [Nicotiana attenuata]|uniref:putative protein TPRXL n=1 Tax=Nicotiana attenuata TaxID=49451 RepID=UPI000905A2FE|nr:PREDICTED: putative protein TPRXL [Nicotiana attenuata]